MERATSSDEHITRVPRNRVSVLQSYGLPLPRGTTGFVDATALAEAVALGVTFATLDVGVPDGVAGVDCPHAASGKRRRWKCRCIALTSFRST
jgi:hypothetical protein